MHSVMILVGFVCALAGLTIALMDLILTVLTIATLQKKGTEKDDQEDNA